MPSAEPAPPLPEDESTLLASSPAIDWGSASDCAAKLRLLEQAARIGSLPQDPEAIPIAVRVQQVRAEWGMPQKARTGWVAADLPLRIVETRIPAEPDVECWIEVGPPRDIEAETREVGREQVRSAYQSGSRRERNPEYEVAQARLRHAQNEVKASNDSIMTVGDPLLDLVGTMVGGLVGAVQGRSRSAELEEALANLAATKRSIEHPVLRHYHFEQAVVQGRRTAVIPVALTGRHARERSTRIRQRESKTFHLLDGLDARDLDYEAHDALSVSPLELARWQRNPPVVPVSMLVRALLEPVAPPPADDQPWPKERPEDLELEAPEDRERIAALGPSVPNAPARTDSAQTVRLARSPDALARRPPPTPAPRPSASFPQPDRQQPQVAILRGAQHGLGVYLSPHTVVAPASLIGDAKVIDAEVRGVRVPALVAARDPALDIALLKLSTAGYPAAFEPESLADGALRLLLGHDMDGTARMLGTVDGSARLRLKLAPGIRPAIGTPVLHEDRLVGLVNEVVDDHAHAVSGLAIQTLLDELPNSDLLLD